MFFHNTAKKSFGTRKIYTPKKQRKDKPWFNKSFKTARKKFSLAKKIHNKYKFGDKCTKDSLKANSKEYNATLDRCMKNNRCD